MGLFSESNGALEAPASESAPFGFICVRFVSQASLIAGRLENSKYGKGNNLSK